MSRNYFKIIAIGTIIFAAHVFVKAQIASAGNYTLDQAVVASGGGASADNQNVFLLVGTIGQPIAGTTSSNASLSLTGGFFTSSPFAPTAASASISGRILTTESAGLKNARVILTDMQGNIRATSTSSFGYYSFSEIEAGQTYILSIISKRYQFAPKVITVMEDIEDLNFTAQSQTLFEQNRDVEK